MVGVVVLQNTVNVHTGFPQCPGCFSGDDTTCRVSGAVGAVGAEGEQGRARKTVQKLRPCQRNFLISSALAGSRQMHHGLTARDKGEGLGRILMVLGDGSQKRAGLPGLTGQ